MAEKIDKKAGLESLPKELILIDQKLEKAGFKAVLVGGCVRDLLLGAAPKDWDITTDAKPDEIIKLFPDSVYENEFGTVGVKIGKLLGDETRGIVEVTTFRKEGGYTDKRHPDSITFSKNIEDDLGRRDFTVNALAVPVGKVTPADFEKSVVDFYGGKEDLKNKIIRAVGNPNERFNEDALRLMRAVRFASRLSSLGGGVWKIEPATREAILKHAGLLEMIAKERIRDEFVKILMTKKAMEGVQMLEDLGLLKSIMPELREGIGVGQNLHHIYSVWEHNLRALDYAAGKNYSLPVRMASLLHDVGKPRSKAGDGPNSTFYAHEYIGAKMTYQMLDRLRFDKNFTEKTAHLVRYHMFYYNTDEVSAAGVRRFLRRVGPENVDDLMQLREADRIGSGVKKAVPYKLRHLLFMIEKVKRDPLSPKMLKVNGEAVMEIGKLKPGPKVGYILSVLLEEVLDDPEKNKKEYLEARIAELALESEVGLAKVAEKARTRRDEFESEAEEEIKKQFYVK